jgi:hypothetical protein
MNYSMKKSKGIVALMIVTVMMLTAMIPLQAFAAAKLSDVAGSWAEKEITAWVDQGFINGYPDGTFKPNNNITRAEFVALINRVFKFSETADITFKDVKDTDWFSKDVAKAEKAGYLSEVKATDSFVLRGNITRQEVAAIIYKLKSLTKDGNEAGKFTDADKIPDYFKGYIGAVKKAGYMQGYPDGSFGPEKNLTRAEAVVSINNIIGIEIEAIPEQTAYVDTPLYVNVKTDPNDAALSAKSSDETILKVEIAGRYVKVTGIKEGSATVTVTVKKEGFMDKDASFTVNVKKGTGIVSSGGGGGSSSGGGGTTTPENKAPSITVSGVTDNTITVIQGTVFTPPVVKATDPEDGDITSRIVMTGNVDTSVVGEYILRYNVTDSKGLAAPEVRITVRVIADVPDHKVDILDSVVPGEKQVYVTLLGNADGSQWRVFIKKGEGRVELEYNAAKNRFQGSTYIADAKAENITFEKKQPPVAEDPDYTIDILDSVVPGEKQVYVTFAEGCDGSQWKVFVKKGDGKVELAYNAAKNRFQGSTYIADAKAENVTLEKKQPPVVEEPDYTVAILDSVVPGEKQVYVIFAEGCDGSQWKVFVKKGDNKVELIYNAARNRFQGATFIADAKAENVTLEKK